MTNKIIMKVATNPVAAIAVLVDRSLSDASVLLTRELVSVLKELMIVLVSVASRSTLWEVIVGGVNSIS